MAAWGALQDFNTPSPPVAVFRFSLIMLLLQGSPGRGRVMIPERLQIPGSVRIRAAIDLCGSGSPVHLIITGNVPPIRARDPRNVSGSARQRFHYVLIAAGNP